MPRKPKLNTYQNQPPEDDEDAPAPYLSEHATKLRDALAEFNKPTPTGMPPRLQQPMPSQPRERIRYVHAVDAGAMAAAIRRRIRKPPLQ